MCLQTIKTILSLGGIILTVLKIAICALLLWFIFGYLNNKIGLLKPFISILKAVFTGIKGAFSLIGFG